MSARQQCEATELLRSRIDEIDEHLVQLIRERIAVSRSIQRTRTAAGGPRVVSSREAQIVSRWHRLLGQPGVSVALALLELGRGRL